MLFSTFSHISLGFPMPLPRCVAKKITQHYLRINIYKTIDDLKVKIKQKDIAVSAQKRLCLNVGRIITIIGMINALILGRFTIMLSACNYRYTFPERIK